MKKLGQKFYNQETIKVAKGLLGKLLVHYQNGKRVSGMITEVEAYLGITDKACHTYAGRRSARVEPMYKSGGHAYVYFIYGMYYCFNVVSQKAEVPEAVLIRSVAPYEGVELIKKRRFNCEVKNLTNGPGKVCQAFKINKSHSGISLLGNKIFIEEFKNVSARNIAKSPRIGIEYAQEARHWPLRFTIIDTAHLFD